MIPENTDTPLMADCPSAPFLSDMELGRRKYSIEWCRKAFSSLNVSAHTQKERVRRSDNTENK